MRTPVLFLSALALLATPAQASTIPPVELGPDQSSLSAGIYDLSFDRALSDRLSVGVSLAGQIPLPLMIPAIAYGGAIRSTYRLWGQAGDSSLGLMMSAGYLYLAGIGVSDSMLFVQPALNGTWAFGNWRMRATLGPTFGPKTSGGMGGDTTKYDWQIIPNLELAYRILPSQELAIGGNSVISWRGIF